MEQKILDTIKKYSMIESGDRLVLGVSGGPDSICMLDILYKLKEDFNFEICVAHINHGIRLDATDDEEYVEDYCKKKNIPFFCKKENVLKIAKEEKISAEEAGRNVRYKFFQEVLNTTRKHKNSNSTYFK